MELHDCCTLSYTLMMMMMMVVVMFLIIKGGLGRLATWHLPDGPVGTASRWSATSNVESKSNDLFR